MHQNVLERQIEDSTAILHKSYAEIREAYSKAAKLESDYEKKLNLQEQIAYEKYEALLRMILFIDVNDYS